MRYSEDLIDEILERNDIVEIIGENVQLRRSGSRYVGLCPFHSEKTPSFSVNPARHMYYCFGCHAGGTTITYLMEYHNYSFVEALQYLADRAGIALPEEAVSKEMRAASKRKAVLLEICKKAASYYYYCLKSPAGQRGADYFRDRGLSDETVRRFGLGYADVRGGLYPYLKSKGFGDEQIRETGLVRFDEKRGPSDEFFNRVIFPITDARGRVIGFGGRVLGDGRPKYLNSPEGPLFNKRKNLYALNYARSARAGYLILCEGYMDVISMHQAGFTGAYASLGTALTSEQAALLRRYTGEVRLLYDSDDAGKKAALRAIPILTEAGLSVRVTDLTPYKDPDEMLLRAGAEALKERLDQAENAFLFEIGQTEKGYKRGDPAEWTAFQKECAAMLLKRFPEPMERDNYTEAVCGRYGFPREDFRRLMARSAARGTAAEHYRPPADASQTARKDGERFGTECRMLNFLINYPEAYRTTKDLIGPEDYTDPFARRMADLLYGQLEKGHVSPAALISGLSEAEDSGRAAEVISREIRADSPGALDRAFTDTVVRILRRKNDEALLSADVTDPSVFASYIAARARLDACAAGELFHLGSGIDGGSASPE